VMCCPASSRGDSIPISTVSIAAEGILRAAEERMHGHADS
jgi:hypothetical protein